ncbi:MAG: hypothetical protein WC749_15455, partial [Dehalococcoidia bacterium]
MNTDPVPYQWALPENLEVPSDSLEIRLDFHHDAIVMYTVDNGTITTRIVSAVDICQALVRGCPVLIRTIATGGPVVVYQFQRPDSRPLAQPANPEGGLAEQGVDGAAAVRFTHARTDIHL